MAGDAHVVFMRITEASAFGAAAALTVTALLLGLWFVWPWWRAGGGPLRTQYGC
jgi:hypothetical protein